ncbi:hypothetical protein COU19_00400 [Candidatus Kaiserbacteria bacterium CG10_big_fil_rev_8_21_14_0_10_56_12]|uniref:DUF218 domain-containing protein n=1 Tax=Candidatus Kaiserbacteria bacterium CG10_big_fil_rev_8_21_14_0_10_56_12 TaxID=1974611 RepID=A0A2H0UAJ5_9BACT|nr:MAG: hypothetical protein COU19_00400 [Candidatus Kaiserbacteria bacterium CG10_big_fil_rev_8_21_14_0_10_56_12]
MEQDTTLAPDAIVVLSGGTVAEKDPQTGAVTYRSTTYEEGDAFGTLGGYARVQAAAVLAIEYPDAFLVTSGKDGPDGVSAARTQASELTALGVAAERIIMEETSVNTATQVSAALGLAADRSWRHMLLVSNRYQIPRIRAFVEHTDGPPQCTVGYQDAESILMAQDPSFEQTFERLKKTEAYQKRLAAEARGVAAIAAGSYRAAEQKDKNERTV